MHFVKHWAAALMASAALFTATAQAAADAPRFEMTPFAGARAGGSIDVEDDAGDQSSVDFGSGAGFGIDLGLYRDRESFYELLYSSQTAAVDSKNPALDGVDLSIDYLQFGGTLLFPREDAFYVPYLTLTIGATFLRPDGDFDSETKFSGSVGGGFRFPLNDSVAVNLGLRGYLTLVNSDTDLFCVSDSSNAGCLVRSTGSTFFQAEGSLGLTVRF